MPAVSRLNDMSSGHDACPPVPAVSGSHNVNVNGRPVLRIGDIFAAHGCPVHPVHTPMITTGSTKVFVNGRAIARIGDQIGAGGCPGGHVIAEGSPNVFCSI